jgi:hypothetical protein
MVTHPLRNEGSNGIGTRTESSQTGETPPRSQHKVGQARGCGLNRATSRRENYVSEHGVHQEQRNHSKNRGTPQIETLESYEG